MSIAQLFLNPVRQGGGAGADVAVRNKIPVVTLPNCDVASIAGESFCCEKLREFPEIVSRYCHNQKFYDKQKMECEKVYEEYDKKDFATECKRVLGKVQSWLQNGEIV